MAWHDMPTRTVAVGHSGRHGCGCGCSQRSPTLSKHMPTENIASTCPCCAALRYHFTYRCAQKRASNSARKRAWMRGSSRADLRQSCTAHAGAECCVSTCTVTAWRRPGTDLSATRGREREGAPRTAARRGSARLLRVRWALLQGTVVLRCSGAGLAVPRRAGCVRCRNRGRSIGRACTAPTCTPCSPPAQHA